MYFYYPVEQLIAARQAYQMIQVAQGHITYALNRSYPVFRLANDLEVQAALQALINQTAKTNRN